MVAWIYAFCVAAVEEEGREEELVEVSLTGEVVGVRGLDVSRSWSLKAVEVAD